ncbi:TIGR04282 family arsenosugar biosynthesis glycosyltransferase [Tautonia sociabilis]|uniref:Glycosyltransferase n=1 Tax=Tautonia sociabilis TaxID=2080755 RepID=A0A432MM76_9BACT|nr:TIGR04282 family arsenosugar biosynthesis glycosyltransferase [Tautonia sociabilis]RUL88544.1 glycosyltransferase [Tautonia sociabilis]
MAWPMPDGAVLGIFGKRPEPGRVKTRLAAEFGDGFAAEAHEAMLLDTLDSWASDRFLAPGGRRVFVYAPADAGPWFDPIVPPSLAMQPQADGDLGARLRAFFAGEFEEGATRVVVIGSDSPTLDPSIVVSAFLCLEGKDVVLGPATDGGYYLIGCRPPVPAIFEGVDWGTPQVLSQTLDRLRGTGRSLAVLPPWYDVDAPDDWRLLGSHVRAMRASGLDPSLPRVEALLPRVLPGAAAR